MSHADVGEKSTHVGTLSDRRIRSLDGWVANRFQHTGQAESITRPRPRSRHRTLDCLQLPETL
jgi:hypothetical protein